MNSLPMNTRQRIAFILMFVIGVIIILGITLGPFFAMVLLFLQIVSFF